MLLEILKKFSQKKFLILAVLLGFIFTTASCAKVNSAIEQASQKTFNAVGCEQFKSEVFNSMYQYLDQQKQTPDINEFRESLNKKLDQLAHDKKISVTEINTVKNEMGQLFKILITDSKNIKNKTNQKITTAKEHLQTLIELEMEDTTTSVNEQLNQQLKNQLQKTNLAIKNAHINCQQPQTENQNTVDDHSVSTNAPNDRLKTLNAYQGMQNVFVTAYQSCQSSEVPAVSAATPNVVGIQRLAQNHPDGIGGRRIVASLPDVQNTHPYIKVSGRDNNSSCFDVYDNPLIYDYGGEPAVTSTQINLFQDSGTGTSALGIDCSAFVSSAVAAAGLRYKPGLDNKPIFIRQSSTKFIDAKKSGFTCFENATMTPQKFIQSGDIVAVIGHVVMIDQVGRDAFGLQRLKAIKDCDNLDPKYFDFTISQSSPSKNGMGINKYKISDYVFESDKIKTAFVSLGQAACKAWFSQTNQKPQSADWGILRHLGTPECRAPQIQLAKQACVSQCLN